MSTTISFVETQYPFDQALIVQALTQALEHKDYWSALEDGAELQVHLDQWVLEAIKVLKDRAQALLSCPAQMPPLRHNEVRRIGAELPAHGEARLYEAVRRLRRQLEEQLRRQGIDVRSLVFVNGEAMRQALGARLSLPRRQEAVDRYLPVEITAPLIPVSADGIRAQGSAAGFSSADPVALMFAGHEHLSMPAKSKDLHAALQEAIARVLAQRYPDADADDCQAAIEGFFQREQPERLVHFLEDQLMARVRAEVSCDLMQAIAASVADESAYAALSRYVARILETREAIREGACAAVLDASSYLGEAGQVALSDWIAGTMLYEALPVWPRGQTQLWEERTEEGIEREVVYRFRVNGQDPQSGKPAFEARLERLQTELTEAYEKYHRGEKTYPSRALAQLAWLAVIFLPDGEKLVTQASRGFEALLEIVERLHAHKDFIAQVARELVQALRRQSTLAELGRARTHTLVVRESLIDWNALWGGQAALPDDLRWFDYVDVKPGHVAARQALLHWTVETKLQVVPWRRCAAIQTYRCVRALDEGGAVLPVWLVPRDDQKTGLQTRIANSPKLGRGVTFQYHPRLLYRVENSSTDQTSGAGGRKFGRGAFRTGTGRGREFSDEDRLYAASLAATTLAIYAVLWVLLRWLQEQMRLGQIAVLRLQQAAPSDRKSGQTAQADEAIHGINEQTVQADEAIYGISRAIEAVLGEVVPIHVQGMALKDSPYSTYRQRGTARALLAGMPLVFPWEGSLERVGVVAFTARPAAQAGPWEQASWHAVLLRSFVAERRDDGMGVLAPGRARVKVSISVEGGLHLLLEDEISRLIANGCAHVMLL